MYCMPYEGETINLYFRNVWEAQALAISGARGNGQSCQKTGDYNHRYFTNHERKEMYIAPDTLSFTADESAAVKIAIVMTDANGIDIVSAKDIVFAADNDIKINIEKEGIYLNTEINTSLHDMKDKIISKNSSYIIFFLMTVPVFLGTSYAAAKIGMRELAPINLAILRFAIASSIFGVILLCMKRNNKIDRIDIPRFLVLGFMAITSFFYIHFSGLQYTTSTNAGLIMATSPVFAAIFCAISRRETVNRVAIIGIVIAFCGVSLVITQGKLEGLFQQKNLMGDILIMCNALVWAGVTIYGTTLLKKYRPFVAMAYIHIFGTALLLPFAFFSSIFVEIPLINQLTIITWPTMLSALYLAVFCSVYSYFIWYTGVEKLGAIKTAVFNYFNPIFAVLTGIILFGEALTAYTICGGLFVIMGVYITNNNK